MVDLLLDGGVGCSSVRVPEESQFCAAFGLSNSRRGTGSDSPDAGLTRMTSQYLDDAGIRP